MSSVIQANDGNFDSEVLQSEHPVLVDFSAAWCGPCKKLEPVVHELASDFRDTLKVVKVDVDQAPNIAAKYAVLSVPTLLLFQGGQVKDQVMGLISKQDLADRIHKVL